jgi:hypothetical protein
MNKKFKRHVSLRPRREAAAAGTTPPTTPSQPRGLACAGMSSTPGRTPYLLRGIDRAPGGP